MPPTLRQLIVEASKALERLHSNGKPVNASRILRLDDVIQLREPMEDKGSIIAEIYGYQSKPLSPRLAVPPRLKARITHIGVDSSSRKLETPLVTVLIGSVSASSSSQVELLDLPPLYSYNSINIDEYWITDHPFIITIPSIPGVLEYRNPAGHLYDEGYSEAQAMDELRVSLENTMLNILAGTNLEDTVVMIDGPLYLVPGALTDVQSPRKYRDAWEKLLNDRINAVRKLEERGVPVIGVVKRIEGSRILLKTVGLEDRIRECLGEVGGIGDKMILYMLQGSCSRIIPGRILATPRIKVRFPVIGLEKIVEYLVVPPGKWQYAPELSRVYRIEYSQLTLGLLEDMGLQPHHVFSLDSIYRGSLAPVTIQLSDRRARSITLALKRLIASEAMHRSIPLSYDTLAEVEAEWRSRLRAAG
ncbi:MAG: DNA double-strand break repair nuclease NurA [Desulfurococcales archaeon]|nr:DNA double-strand break repair nuclease NurA [Desulfurococcales archaeon]